MHVVTSEAAWSTFVDEATGQRELRPDDWRRLARFCAAVHREGLDLFEREATMSEQLRGLDFAGRHVRDILLVVMHSAQLYDALTDA